MVKALLFDKYIEILSEPKKPRAKKNKELSAKIQLTENAVIDLKPEKVK